VLKISPYLHSQLVYYYEKALQLNPNDREIIDNLELINKTLVDEIDPITIPLIESILNRVSNIFYFETWGYISIFFSFFNRSIIFILLLCQ